MSERVPASRFSHEGHPRDPRSAAVEIVAYCVKGGLSTVLQIELHQDRADMGLHGLLREDKRAGNLAVGPAAGDLGEHLTLSFGQPSRGIAAGNLSSNEGSRDVL